MRIEAIVVLSNQLLLAAAEYGLQFLDSARLWGVKKQNYRDLKITEQKRGQHDRDPNETYSTCSMVVAVIMRIKVMIMIIMIACAHN